MKSSVRRRLIFNNKVISISNIFSTEVALMYYESEEEDDSSKDIKWEFEAENETHPFKIKLKKDRFLNHEEIEEPRRNKVHIRPWKIRTLLNNTNISLSLYRDDSRTTSSWIPQFNLVNSYINYNCFNNSWINNNQLVSSNLESNTNPFILFPLIDNYSNIEVNCYNSFKKNYSTLISYSYKTPEINHSEEIKNKNIRKNKNKVHISNFEAIQSNSNIKMLENKAHIGNKNAFFWNHTGNQFQFHNKSKINTNYPDRNNSPIVNRNVENAISIGKVPNKQIRKWLMIRRRRVMRFFKQKKTTYSIRKIKFLNTKKINQVQSKHFFDHFVKMTLRNRSFVKMTLRNRSFVKMTLRNRSSNIINEEAKNIRLPSIDSFLKRL